jgi:hypothetical protein
MSISYEEALGTLSAMFGDPWTQDTLDTVLRIKKGHMENTVEAILQHGDGDPQALIKQLQSGASDSNTAMDEAIARQIAQEERGGSGGRRSTTTTSQPAPAPKPKGRGTPTELPPDFLRIPGAPIPTAASNSTMDADEALARMLQDELFSQELANNPEFAHLARGGRPRMVGGRPSRSRNVGEMPRASAAGYPGGGHRRDHHEGPNILDKLSGKPATVSHFVLSHDVLLVANLEHILYIHCIEMGGEARSRLAAFAAQWNEKNRGTSNSNMTAMGARGTAVQETRGLLDDDDDGEEMEMTFAGTGGKKNM